MILDASRMPRGAHYHCFINGREVYGVFWCDTVRRLAKTFDVIGDGARSCYPVRGFREYFGRPPSPTWKKEGGEDGVYSKVLRGDIVLKRVTKQSAKALRRHRKLSLK